MADGSELPDFIVFYDQWRLLSVFSIDFTMTKDYPIRVLGYLEHDVELQTEILFNLNVNCSVREIFSFEQIDDFYYEIGGDKIDYEVDPFV